MNEYRKRLQFENGYGLSIVSHSFSYGGMDGLFEAALLDEEGNILYDESLGFSDVQGHLDFEQVASVINKIRSLPARQ
jgi:hypothetical protein